MKIRFPNRIVGTTPRRARSYAEARESPAAAANSSTVSLSGSSVSGVHRDGSAVVGSVVSMSVWFGMLLFR